MIVSGVLNGPVDPTAPTPSPASPPPLTEGRLLSGRISQASPDGQGIVRFPNGSGFAFTGGQALRVGDQVTLEVLRLVPEVTLRLLSSDSAAAASLARSASRGLLRAPDLLQSLLRPASGLLAGRAPLAEVAREALPDLSLEGLLKGDVTRLARLLENSDPREVMRSVARLRQAAVELEPNPARPGQVDAAELGSVRSGLRMLGDALAMQHLLPQVATPEDGSVLLGYRLFWMHEGGVGEAIWREEREKERGRKSGKERLQSVLLSLNMTRLGMVQARLAYGEGLLRVAIAARDEAALTELRASIGDLRRALIVAELPLHSLDLAKLPETEMRAERARAMGLGSGFEAEI
ncbi:MAG: flagellar hook-length control protein FliK [Magnetococcales bacterium]|nr:flagellar hook-length control protein FliK [Magnetococcales bacterium]